MTARRRAGLVALTVAGLLALPARGAAATCAPAAALGAADPHLVALDPEVRLSFIDGELARDAQRAHLWVWGWGIALAVGTVGNLVPVPFVKADGRIDWYTGAVTTAVGIVPLLVAPPDVLADARELHARLGARGATDACALLADAETRLARDAKNQADGRRWWVHAGNAVLNAGVGLFLGLGFHHWTAGILNTVSGVAIGEVIIFTQPTDAIESLRRYREGAFGDGAAPATTVSFTHAF